ncbi:MULTISPECIES: hypothetical protein [Thermus]|jgi:hypothetical protein|uniref:Uncharacterized protein n=1 Tax=Thermus brockianus TaxID=56956 RepID=A0A1J0LR36_THEBO|nr:hypothetical protein [Thermus brockianus]APD08514.1 hypothetical protein A0O31_00296 [Thermus brockianus]BDG16133.1 hypothetical protein TbrSNM41_08670 [Thermus brockianus]
MRLRLAALAFLLPWALAQSLLVPPEAPVGQPLTLEGRDLPEGRFPLEVEGPQGTKAQEVAVQGGSFRLTLTPEAPGEYRVRLVLPSGALEGRFLAQGQPTPTLTEEGLRLPWGLLALPKGPWLGPLVQGERVYLAQGLLVLEASLKEPGVRYHYAPAKVVALRPGPEALLEGERVLPIPFPPLPFEGSEEDLKALAPLLQALMPPKPWPYFAYWALDPENLGPEDLEAYRQDLLARGHRPELPYAFPPVLAMAEAARRLEGKEPETARLLTDTLLRTSPLFPGSLAFFQERAEALEAQGLPAQALRLRVALETLKAWSPPNLEGLSLALAVLAVAYLALLLYLVLFYLPPQLRDLRNLGGFLGGFFRHPLLRLRHLSLAYASFGERLLALLLLLALGAATLLHGLDQQARKALFAPPLDRGSLRTQAALDWLRSLPPTPETQALLGYALLPEAPQEAKGLLEGSGLPFALALTGEEKALAEAYRKAPLEGPLRTALGLGTDPWGAREAGPSARTLYLALLRLGWGQFWEDPWRTFLALPLPLPERARPWAFLGYFALLFYHLLAFLLPRRKGTVPPTYALLVRLFVPGSLGFAAGLGVLLLFLAAWGLVRLGQGEGPGLLLAAYALHLLGLALSLRRP